MANLAEQIAVLRNWDQRWAADSIATSLAVFWGEQSNPADKARPGGLLLQESPDGGVSQPAARLAHRRLRQAHRRLRHMEDPMGDINRFQRLTGDIVQPFNDAAPSIPVPFTSSLWGSLASFGARAYPGTKKRYGTSGNSFVAVVEFGQQDPSPRRHRRRRSGRSHSPHFNDESTRYASGNLRSVYFYPEDLKEPHRADLPSRRSLMSSPHRGLRPE